MVTVRLVAESSGWTHVHGDVSWTYFCNSSGFALQFFKEKHFGFNSNSGKKFEQERRGKNTIKAEIYIERKVQKTQTGVLKAAQLKDKRDRAL